MANFVRATNGELINLDHVLSIKPASFVVTNSESNEYIFYYKGGERAHYTVATIDEQILPVIPAPTLLYVTVIYYDEDNEKLGVEEDLIVGWQNFGEFCNPVYRDNIQEFKHVYKFLRLPNGKLIHLGTDEVFVNIGAAQDYVLSKLNARTKDDAFR